MLVDWLRDADPAWVQAIGTIVLTLALVLVTIWYARETGKIASLTGDAVVAAEEQAEGSRQAVKAAEAQTEESRKATIETLRAAFGAELVVALHEPNAANVENIGPGPAYKVNLDWFIEGEAAGSTRVPVGLGHGFLPGQKQNTLYFDPAPETPYMKPPDGYRWPDRNTPMESGDQMVKARFRARYEDRYRGDLESFSHEFDIVKRGPR